METRVRAAVVCYHCGHESGEIEATRAGRMLDGDFLPAAAGKPRRAVGGAYPRCLRCGGPTYIENARPIVVETPHLITWHARGRPPKHAIRITLPTPVGVKRRRPKVVYAMVVGGDRTDLDELAASYAAAM
jgi:hypothetical protein